MLSELSTQTWNYQEGEEGHGQQHVLNRRAWSAAGVQGSPRGHRDGHTGTATPKSAPRATTHDLRWSRTMDQKENNGYSNGKSELNS